VPADEREAGRPMTERPPGSAAPPGVRSEDYAAGFRAGRQFETWHPGAADPAEISDALAERRT
jgi:hypothetical protein